MIGYLGLKMSLIMLRKKTCSRSYCINPFGIDMLDSILMLRNIFKVDHSSYEVCFGFNKRF
ncbi:hypothetical protein Q7M_1338 (plasmid) [Borrelia crocidurae str. Achema]|uniref:Uncharacterized protein n=1 Tax=Borrelia crocidurae (strain Achema) TaxID=1155096 RepID=I0FF38_BORCA|nr:hypothetical protein Q7M_1338 [Borrelia crocidurae str. Achema]